MIDECSQITHHTLLAQQYASHQILDYDYVLNESSGASVDTFVETLGIHFVTRLDWLLSDQLA